MICAFFGHRDAPIGLEEKIRMTIKELIENCGVDTFYVGNQGDFDRMVCGQLAYLSTIYPIVYYNVLAYIPKRFRNPSDYSHALLPDGIEKIYPKYAINYRNKWMLEKADIVVTYVIRDSWYGAAAFMSLAEKKGKTVINLHDSN